MIPEIEVLPPAVLMSASRFQVLFSASIRPVRLHRGTYMLETAVQLVIGAGPANFSATTLRHNRRNYDI